MPGPSAGLLLGAGKAADPPALAGFWRSLLMVVDLIHTTEDQSEDPNFCSAGRIFCNRDG